MPTPTVFAGLDFSGAREPLHNLWSCVGVDRDAKLHVLDLRPHAYRQDALDFIRDGSAGIADGASLWGLDFPFSLSNASADALFPTPQDWPALCEAVARCEAADLAERGKPFAKDRRAIDVGTAMAPLDLRVHKQTHAGMRLLDELRREPGVAVLPFVAPDPLAGVRLIEVYPSITARDLGVTGRKPARPGDAAARPVKLAPHVTFDHPSLAATAATLEDAWDTTLAALTAWLVRDDLDQPARLGVPAETTRREGWIFRHPDTAAAPAG